MSHSSLSSNDKTTSTVNLVDDLKSNLEAETYTKYLQMSMQRRIAKRKLNKTIIQLDANLCDALKQYSKLIMECENTRNHIERAKFKCVENEITSTVEKFFLCPEATTLIDLDTTLAEALVKLESRAHDLVLKNAKLDLSEQEEFETYLRNIVKNLSILEQFCNRIQLEKSEKYICNVSEKNIQLKERFTTFARIAKTVESLLIVSTGLDIVH